MAEPPPPSDLIPDADPSHGGFGCLPIPPLDPLFFSTNNPPSSDGDFVPDLPLTFDDNYDFDITLDDLDDIYFPSENESFVIPDRALAAGSTGVQTNGYTDDFPSDPVANSAAESGSSSVSDADKYLNCPLSEAGSCNSVDRSSDSDRVRDFSSPTSSQVSGNGGSGLSMDAPSPDSGHYMVDEKIKVEDDGTVRNSLSKRKKENCEDASGETRSQKYQRSENVNPNSNKNNVSLQYCGGLSEEEEKRNARLMRNRESAQLSRQRKKHYVDELEDKVRTMHSTIAELNTKISYFMAENVSLRQQLSGNGMCPPPPVYHQMGPVGYPWMPCVAPPYVVKPQGSQVPLVPIPRLKPQQPVPATKPKKVETKKAVGRTKKVASVSFLGLLFFILLFGGLVPIVDVKFGVRESGSNGLAFFNERFYDRNRGRVLIVDGNLNGSNKNMDVGSTSGKFNVGSRIICNRSRSKCSEYDMEKKGDTEYSPCSSESANVHKNASEPLVASLYVPRNDKLVKIDGNLIIHSVLASERAMASHATPKVDSKQETGLAIPSHLSAVLAIPDVGTNRGRHPHSYPTSNERQRALSSGYADSLKDHLKSSAADGKLQQWFHEGLTGPMLSSGMCSEVFQFDVSPAPGAIVPASSVTNITTKHKHNATHPNKRRSRRILHGLPISFAGSDLNITKEKVGRNSQKDNFEGNKSVSPMVVSVLVDPREAGDSDVDGVMKPKSLSRIFVVVLLDSVKYVTYSCMLPWSSGPHLVTT